MYININQPVMNCVIKYTVKFKMISETRKKILK